MIRTRNVRKTTEFKRSIKAISPVIATLLMIAISVVASLVAYAWVMGYMGFQTSNTGKAIQVQSFAPGSSGHMLIYVQNVGDSLVEIDTIFIDNSIAPINTPTDLTIGQGETKEIDVTSAWTPGTKIEIKVTTTSGTFSEIKGSGTSGQIATPPTHGPATSIVVTPDPASIASGANQAFTAMASDGSVNWDVSSLATWSVNPSSGGTFATNVLTGGTVGTSYTVTATYSSVSDTAPLSVKPSSTTTILRPNNDGTYSDLDDNWQNHDGWECVRETSDSHYVENDFDTNYQSETYTIDDMPSGTINSVTVYLRVAKTTPSDGYSVPNPNAMIRLRLGSTNLDGNAISITSTTFTEASQIFTNKPGGTGWLWTDINNLQAGIRLQETAVWHNIQGSGDHWDVSEARCSQFWIVVNFTPS